MRLAVIGTGSMAKGHVRAYKEMEDVQVVACCDLVEDRLEEFADKWEIPERFTDFREMLSQVKPDGVSVVTPDAAHAEVTVGVLEAGIPVLCEKPMASTLEEARTMHSAWEKADVVAMINYSKRNSSGLQMAGQYVRDGGIGDLRHMEASYLQNWLAGGNGWGDWRQRPGLLWRLSTRHGSTGVLGDLGCHIYDMSSFLCGDISQIYCSLETYDKGIDRIEDYVFDANDSMVATVTFANGVLGTIHSTRWAPGYKNREFVRVYGTKGSIEVDFDKSRETYQIHPSGADGWETVECEATPSNYERFVTSIKTGVNDESDFPNALKIQQYLHASMLSSEENRPVRIE
jgi:predicted dehydrogenase